MKPILLALFLLVSGINGSGTQRNEYKSYISSLLGGYRGFVHGRGSLSPSPSPSPSLDSCPDYLCETTSGAICEYPLNPNVNETVACQFPGLACNENPGTTGNCIAAAPGTSCSSQLDCLSNVYNLWCNSSHQCAHIHYVGDQCDPSSDHDPCTYGTCDPSSRLCVGTPEGGSCSSDLECFFTPSEEGICTPINNTCIKAKKTEESCNQASDVCREGSLCYILTSPPTCVAIYSLALGEASFDDYFCESGYVNSQFVCAKAPQAKNAGAPCTSAGDCPTTSTAVYGTCACTLQPTDNIKVCNAVYPPALQALFLEESALFTCAFTHGCIVPSNFMSNPDSCVSRSCSRELNTLLCSLNTYINLLTTPDNDEHLITYPCVDTTETEKLFGGACSSDDGGGMSAATEAIVIVICILMFVLTGFGIACWVRRQRALQTPIDTALDPTGTYTPLNS